ncbi:MAG: hypothetical protein OEY07_20815, partial [Gammaproteobacteria bacterium]|nr:hypothetical protein [Gammaproteobacteria bacterium]
MNKQQLQHYRNAHAGETIIVCGCGASLNELHDPAAYITIGVNDVGRQFDPDYLVVLNNKHQFRNDRFKYVADSRAKTVFTQLNLGIRHPNIVKFRLGQRGGTDIAGLDSLPYTRNSPYVAVCLAAYMGAKHIGLIGVDFTEHHFFAKTGKHVLAGQINAIDKEYGELYAALAQQGIRLVNLSMQSRLTSLPKQNIADFTLDKPVTVAANPVTSDNGQKHSTRSCDMKIVIERYNPGIVGDFLDALAVTAKRLDYDVHRTVRSGRAPRGAISVVWN